MANTKKTTVTTLDSWSSLSEKTVFILDRARYLTQVSSGHSIEGDTLDKTKKICYNEAIKPFDRSLWTCTIEAVVGYSRLVWDLFTPDQRSVSILTVGPYNDNQVDSISEPTFLERICTWDDDDQNLDHLLKKLGKMSYSHQVSQPNKLISTDNISSFPNCTSDSLSIHNALEEALNQLSQLTPSQLADQEKIKGQSTSRSTGNDQTWRQNIGRIILITSFKDEETVQKFLDSFERMLSAKNEILSKPNKQDSGLAPINYCDLVLVNTYPITDSGSCSKINNFSCFRPHVHCKTYSVKSGRNIAGLLNNLCLQHYNLKSTTITGIPMKEEQNSNSSSQYDVEIVHCSSVHEDILNSDSSLLNGVIEQIDRNGFPCDTFKLSWCTPRNNNVDLYHCVAISRITSVDVNSRPSACLTNFLLAGRTVMLEIFKSKNARLSTHILTSHNGELYIHALATKGQQSQASKTSAASGSQAIQDVPPMSDLLGGRVADYRLNDFVEFMRQNTFAKSHMTNDPLARTMRLIRRQTLYWPLSLGHTILLNVPQLVGNLLNVIPKECLNQIDIDESKAAIDQLIKYEKEAHALPSVSIVDVIKSSSGQEGNRSSGASTGSNKGKLGQLYRLLWNELEYFLRVHSSTVEHEAILEYMLNRRNAKRADPDKSLKRPAGKVANSSESGPASKRLKLDQQVIPELNLANPAIQQSLVLFKNGVSLWKAYIRLYNENNRTRRKLPFVGRMKPHPLVPNPGMQATLTASSTITPSNI